MVMSEAEKVAELVMKASVIPYPSEMPVDEVRTVIAIVMAKDFATRKEELAKSLWIIVGYGLGKTLKDPSVPSAPMAFQGLSDDDALETLQLLETSAQPGAPMAMQIPNSLIIWALDWLVKYLKG